MSIRSTIRKLLRPSRAIILMYHRIADPATDPWQLCVSEKNFADHLGVIATTGNVISLNELVEDIRNRKVRKNSICITFDDGYEDNFLYALPLIEKFGCPSTFFISSGSIGSQEQYWWDTLADIFLSAKKLPEFLEIDIGNRFFHYQLENNGYITMPEFKQHKTWHWPLEPPTQRSNIYFEIWQHLRDMPAAIIKETIDKLITWSGIEPVNVSGSFPMSKQQLLSMSENKFADIGVHTVTHAALSILSRQMQEKEINDCREYLDESLDNSHASIAFPYGNYNADTLDIVRKNGFRSALTTEARPVTVRSDLYQLGRYQVINQTRVQFAQQLHTWLNN